MEGSIMKKCNGNTLIWIVIGIVSIVAAIVTTVLILRSKFGKEYLTDECDDCTCTCDDCYKKCCNKFFEEEYEEPKTIEE